MLVCCLACLCAAGCANVRVTNPDRTATEQFLLSQAAIAAVEPLNVDPLRGRKVFVESRYFAPAEKEFVIAEVRAKLLVAGVQVVNDTDKAEVILELRSGGVGIDRYESLLGIPPIYSGPAGSVPTAKGLSTTILTPEIALTKEIKQISYASVAFVAYLKDTGEVVATSGPHLGKAYRDDWWLLGFGPRTLGTIPSTGHDLE